MLFLGHNLVESLSLFLSAVVASLSRIALVDSRRRDRGAGRERRLGLSRSKIVSLERVAVVTRCAAAGSPSRRFSPRTRIEGPLSLSHARLFTKQRVNNIIYGTFEDNERFLLAVKETPPRRTGGQFAQLLARRGRRWRRVSSIPGGRTRHSRKIL